MMEFDGGLLIVSLFAAVVGVAFSVTDPNDLKILIDFKNGSDNPELLKWPDNGDDDPCGPPSWPHVFCSGNRVSQIQVQNLGLKGPLPQNINQLTRLSNVGLQRNSFSGNLPSFSGLSELEFAYLDFNEFDTIPSDFFNGLSSLRVLALDYNPFNKSTGWSIPSELANSAQLTNLSLVNCNLVGAVPDFLGTLPSLTALKLSYNRLSGEIPASFGESPLQILWLNDQDGGGGMTGSIDVIGKMASLTQIWLHGNQFSGIIPESISNLTSLKDLNLNRNQLVGLIPQSLASMELDSLDLSNNQLMGPVPTFKAGNVSFASNSFCQDKAGVQCAPEVTALLDFLGGMSYPVSLASQWSGNDPCGGNWLGLSCNPNSKVSIINLPRHNLTGTLSASLAKLGSLVEIRVGKNNIHGTVPNNFTELGSLRMLDISGNNLQPPLPEFHNTVKVVIDGNPLLVSNQTAVSPSPTASVPESPETPSDNPSQGGAVSPPSSRKDSPNRGMNSTSGSIQNRPDSNRHGRFIVFAIVGCAAAGLSFLLAMILAFFFCKKRKKLIDSPTSIVVQRKDPCERRNMVKITSKKSSESFSSQTVKSSGSSSSSVTQSAYAVDARNLVISVQVLQKVTNNFSNENELGRGGFGTVYKGELEDGTKLAVKRMEGGIVTSKAVDEFQAEIAVLSKVRHRHLVSLLGYSVEGNERLLVYEFMPQGALSRHLFHWKSLKLEPLSWTRRLAIALDVARGIEYLHCLARHTFIHRDLKSSNILLDDDFRAKVSDFGLVKLVPDGEKSFVTRLAGTFGYLAPEYAGK